MRAPLSVEELYWQRWAGALDRFGDTRRGLMGKYAWWHLLGVRAIALLLVTIVGGIAHAQDPLPSSVLAEAGWGTSISDAEAAAPAAAITVDAPIPVGNLNRLRTALALLGSPSSTAVDFRDVRTFQGLEMNVEAEHEIGRTECSIGLGRDERVTCEKRGQTYAYLVVKAGGATRRDAEGVGPSVRFPGWLGAGLAIEHRDKDGRVDRRLTVIYGADQLSSPDSWTPRHLVASGHVRLLHLKGGSLTIGGEFHRPLWGNGRSVARVTSMMGYGG